MKVHVKDLLASSGAVIEDQPERIRNVFLFSNFIGNDHQMPEEILVVYSCVIQHGQRFFGNYENMDRGLRVYIPECKAQIILIDNIRRNLFVDDLHENCLSHFFSLPLRSAMQVKQITHVWPLSDYCNCQAELFSLLGIIFSSQDVLIVSASS